MSDLDDLYQQVILDHSRNPRNFRAVDPADGKADGYNPLCGDRVTIFVNVEGGKVTDAAFVGKGCAICTASASMMTQQVKGRSAGELKQMFEQFHRMLTQDDTPDDEQALGKLAAFHGVRKYPVRVKCATLPWHTLKAALDHENQPVSTE